MTPSAKHTQNVYLLTTCLCASFPPLSVTNREQSAGDSDRQVGRLGNGMENQGGGFLGGDPAEGLWLTE